MLRGHRDELSAVYFDNAREARPAPGVLEALQAAGTVVIGPSNPPLSIWPILAVEHIRRAVAAAPRVIAVSPLFGGKTLKGPADRVMAALGLPPGNAGVLAAYEGLLTDLVIDEGDRDDVARLGEGRVRIHAADTRITEPAAARALRRMAAGVALTISIHPVPGLPEIRPGDDLAGLLAHALSQAGLGPEPGDVLVVTHKAVSKAEGAVVPLEGEEEAAYRRLVEDQAVEILRRRGSLVIAKTRHGFICANAGVDRSNTAPGTAVLLPAEPDRSAHSLRLALRRLTGVDLPVVITDTFGRAWRKGLVDVAIGVSGLEVILDLRGTHDAQGRELKVTEVAVVDEIAAAADLAMGKAAGVPAALVRGLAVPRGEGRAVDLIRPPGEDMFR